MMIKKLFLIIILPFFTILSLAQEDWCGFDAILEEEMEANPNFMQELSDQVKQMRLEAETNPVSKSTTFIIPVVFHVIHDGGEGNITMEQIQSGIDVMNEDFQALNTDASTIRNTADAPFQSIHADVDVEFRLAKRDPNGNCTNGVQRKFAPHLTNDAGESCKYDANGGLNAWPNDKYINIWTVNSIANNNTQGITLGYAFLPYNNWGSGHGILNRHDRVGRVGTAAVHGGRTLTHEMGHICGLLHTFQNDCAGPDCEDSGDFVCDTPPSEQNFGCNQTLNSCSNVPANDFFGFAALDQNENHMSYATCRRMFTEGQKDLMHNVFTSIPNFMSITSPANIDATGVDLPDVLCKADFYANKVVLCPGEEIQFFDNSYHGQTEWEWSFQGASPASSTDQNPVVSYSAPGTYEVTLTVGDGVDTDTETKTAYIEVRPIGVELPYFESFENYNEIPNSDWSVTPIHNSSWTLGEVGLTGEQSAQLTNFGKGPDNTDELISPLIDLSGVSDKVTLTYRYAYRKRNPSNQEQMTLAISSDCGESWSIRQSLQGNQLGSESSASFWLPESDDDWVTVHLTNITSAFWSDNFRFKFTFNSGGGNNLLIDDINIYEGEPSDEPVLNVSDFAEHGINYTVYPNPANDIVKIDFSVVNNVGIHFQLTDSRGQIVERAQINAKSGNNQVYFSVNDLAKGVYYLSGFADGEPLKTKKIVIQ